MKKLISWILVVSTFFLISSSAIGAEAGLSNFSFKKTYEPGQFQDVPVDTWFAEGVKAAYELGLVNGTSEGTFAPNGNITIAEALALACRLHCVYFTGDANFPQGDPWYQPYVDYALSNNIIQNGQFPDYTAVATRAEFAVIMSNALPEDAWTPINAVTQLPDVPDHALFAQSALKLYNAGVLTGSDPYGTFNAESNIQRGEVATIVTRMATPAQRKSFTLKEKPVEVSSLLLSGESSAQTGVSIPLSVSISPANASNQSVTWDSSDWSVATVSPEGVVLGKAAGTVVITATANNGVSASHSITFTKPPAISAPSPDVLGIDVLFKDHSGLGFYINSADGVTMTWVAKNISGKTIKYLTCYVTMYNAVGDLAYSTTTHQATKAFKLVGPIAPDSPVLISDAIVGYSSVCRKIVIDKIVLGIWTAPQRQCHTDIPAAKRFGINIIMISGLVLEKRGYEELFLIASFLFRLASTTLSPLRSAQSMGSGPMAVWSSEVMTPRKMRSA